MGTKKLTKKVAVMLDLGFVLHALYKPVGKRTATASEVHEFAKKCVLDGEELFRIYCYHCPPYAMTEQHPLTRKPVHFKQSATYTTMSALHRELAIKDNVALREGEISFNGWALTKQAAQDIAKSGRAVQETDFHPDLKQKRVDIKIGLDVAWLSSKAIVDRIVLVTGDSDFIPAMKFARREGVQVILVTMDQHVKNDMRVHADEVRSVTFP